MKIPEKISATRSELLGLKKKIKLAKRGHSLLKEKRDALMKEFMELVTEAKEKRETVDRKLEDAFDSLAMVRALMTSKETDSLFIPITKELTVSVEIKSIMSVSVPSFETEDFAGQEYGFYRVPGEAPLAFRKFEDVLPLVISLAETEKKIKLLASEIEKTRRRVNALEHVLIPRFEEQAKVIKMKLDELERSAFSILMKIKSDIGGESI